MTTQRTHLGEPFGSIGIVPFGASDGWMLISRTTPYRETLRFIMPDSESNTTSMSPIAPRTLERKNQHCLN